MKAETDEVSSESEAEEATTVKSRKAGGQKGNTKNKKGKKSKEERWFDGFIGVGLILKAVSQLPPAQWAAIPVQRGNDDKSQISFYDKQLTFVCPEMMISGRLQLI